MIHTQANFTFKGYYTANWMVVAGNLFSINR